MHALDSTRSDCSSSGRTSLALRSTSLIAPVGTIDGTGISLSASRDYSTLGGGLFRSVNGGADFSPDVGTGPTDLPAGAVPSIVRDPNSAQRVFAAAFELDKILDLLVHAE